MVGCAFEIPQNPFNITLMKISRGMHELENFVNNKGKISRRVMVAYYKEPTEGFHYANRIK